MKLVITEKPSTAAITAHVVGAREKIYGEGKEFCYKGNDYYVVGARGHLYSLGLPQDYGYSRTYKLDELPIFPDFRIFPDDPKKDDLRRLISQLMSLDEVTEIINACDAGREGELIFRHIYNANNCKKPVKRLWTNSMTDEAIRACLDNLPPDSDFDGEYYAALAREKADWLIGMNLSRLYGILDSYPHRIGRVKTPVLSIVAERDKEIENFRKTVTYRLEMDNGALSNEFWNTSEEAEQVRSKCAEKPVAVFAAVSAEKKENRPLLHSLTTLQQEANRVYGLTAKQVLDTAQSLYEKKFITYPRTDCNFISEDMKNKVIQTVSSIGNSNEYSERVKKLTEQGLNLDERVVNNKKMNGHDHHAIIPEVSEENNGLSENERKVYELVVNRLLCAVDKEYSYIETNYEFKCEDMTFTLKSIKPTALGWKAFDTRKEVVSDHTEYSEGVILNSVNIGIKECASKPKNHFTDETLLSVMNNIDNRIEDKELKAAINGKGIGTEATRADIIEQLVNAGYLERQGKMIVVTRFGKDFAGSIPDNVKSVERSAEWEQIFTSIKNDNSKADSLIEDVKEFVKSVITYEKDPDRHRTPVECENPYNSEAVGACPRCGSNVFESKKGYFCESGKDNCGFVLWKKHINIKGEVSRAKAEKLLKGESVPFNSVTKDGKEYTANFALEDNGVYINLKTKRETVGNCPRCGSPVYEGSKNYYCSGDKDKCGFTLWKEEKYNGITITAANAKDLLQGKPIYKQKKKLNGEAVKTKYSMTDTGSYVNIRSEKE